MLVEKTAPGLSVLWPELIESDQSPFLRIGTASHESLWAHFAWKWWAPCSGTAAFLLVRRGGQNRSAERQELQTLRALETRWSRSVLAAFHSPWLPEAWHPLSLLLWGVPLCWNKFPSRAKVNSSWFLLLAAEEPNYQSDENHFSDRRTIKAPTSNMPWYEISTFFPNVSGNGLRGGKNKTLLL